MNQQNAQQNVEQTNQQNVEQTNQNQNGSQESSRTSMDDLIADFRRRYADQQVSPVEQKQNEQADFDIHIKNLQGDIKILSVNSNLVISEIKQRIQNTDGVDAKNIRLIYGGKELDDKSTIGTYDIQKGATIQWVLRLTGGC